jgi:integrase
VATLALALSAISQAHQVAGYPSPRSDRLVRETWKGVRRRVGVAQDQKDPISAKEIRRMMDELPAGLIGLRDRALITLGFAGGFRRSELVALDRADLKFVTEGLEALVRRSKTDQEGAGLTKVTAYGGDPSTCPVRALKDWLELAGIVEGPVFRPIRIACHPHTKSGHRARDIQDSDSGRPFGIRRLARHRYLRPSLLDMRRTFRHRWMLHEIRGPNIQSEFERCNF